MRLSGVLLTVFVSVLLQVALARFAGAGTWGFDLVLVGTVFAALQGGPVAGLVAGTTGGLLQDLLGGGIVGVGGLMKTVVGFLAGTVGSQVVLSRAHSQTLLLAAASVVHRVGILALGALIAQQWVGLPWRAVLTEMGVNAACGFVLFQGMQALPGVIERQRVSRRSGISRRQW